MATNFCCVVSRVEEREIRDIARSVPSSLSSVGATNGKSPCRLDTSASPTRATDPDHYSHLRTFLKFNLFSLRCYCVIIMSVNHGCSPWKASAQLTEKTIIRFSQRLPRAVLSTSLSTQFLLSPRATRRSLGMVQRLVNKVVSGESTRQFQIACTRFAQTREE